MGRFQDEIFGRFRSGFVREEVMGGQEGGWRLLIATDRSGRWWFAEEMELGERRLGARGKGLERLEEVLVEGRCCCCRRCGCRCRSGRRLGSEIFRNLVDFLALVFLTGRFLRRTSVQGLLVLHSVLVRIAGGSRWGGGIVVEMVAVTVEIKFRTRVGGDGGRFCLVFWCAAVLLLLIVTARLASSRTSTSNTGATVVLIISIDGLSIL